MATSPQAFPPETDADAPPLFTPPVTPSTHAASSAADGDFGAAGPVAGVPDDLGLAGFGDTDSQLLSGDAADSLRHTAEKAQELPQQWLDAYCEQVRARPLAAIGLGVAAGMLLVRALF